jgi:hypothetical protein
MKVRRFALVMALAAAVTAVGVRASQPIQNTQPVASQADTSSPGTLKLTVTISRYQGEKKTGSLPFVLMLVPGIGRDGDTVQLQMGSDVPVPQPLMADGKPVSSYSYRSVGTNIMSSAARMDDGTFRVRVDVTDSQVMSDTNPSMGGGLPRFQTFRSSNRLTMRDGQTLQYTAAADKTSGEFVKLEVMLNVVK